MGVVIIWRGIWPETTTRGGHSVREGEAVKLMLAEEVARIPGGSSVRQV
jgi:hypothetical protein